MAAQEAQMASCKATTKAGTPCRAKPLHGTSTCLAHADAETRTKMQFLPGGNGKGGRKKQPRLIDILRQEVEDRMQEVTAPFWEGLKSGDQKVRMECARELLDRSYGKPKQVSEVSGPEGGPIETVEIPTSDDWNAKVAKVLAESGALDADSDQDQ